MAINPNRPQSVRSTHVSRAPVKKGFFQKVGDLLGLSETKVQKAPVKNEKDSYHRGRPQDVARPNQLAAVVRGHVGGDRNLHQRDDQILGFLNQIRSDAIGIS